jgi:tetratricopeptide (TPR) repeat protein
MSHCLPERRGRPTEAVAQWHAALRERPAFMPAWLGLGDLYLRQGQWAELEGLSERLETARPARGPVLSVMLRARAHQARQEWAAARQEVDEALVQRPREVLLWVVLSHVLLQEGRHAEAAEQALWQILELDPANAEARTNLAVLRQRRGLPASV